MHLPTLEQTLASRQRRTIPLEGRPAASVLVPLYGPGPDYQVIYTVRSYRVEHHKGEISFPGGAAEPHDGSFEATALRESFEEVGIARHHVTVLGLLDDIVTRSGFVVTPVVGRVETYPYAFVVDAVEVAELLEVPLSHLRDEANHVPHPNPREGVQPPFPSYQFGEHVIFGATASITAGFLHLAPPLSD